MRILFHHLIENMAARRGTAPALVDRRKTSTYAELWDATKRAAGGLQRAGLARNQRVGVYLDKRHEAVVACLASSAAGGVFVPINPQLKSHQVDHILRDCNVRILVTTRDRLELLRDELVDFSQPSTVVIVDEGIEDVQGLQGIEVLSFADLGGEPTSHPVVETDMAAILYTSGSTGKPKGVVLSHRNLMVGAESVSHYLNMTCEDRVLAVLPLSFDAGLSQLTTAFWVGGSAVLLNYLLPRDVVRYCEKHQITGLTCVPPLWMSLAQETWPPAAVRSLRYFANTGGHLARSTLATLRQSFPDAKPYLMYGLTEAFRSTYLDPAEVDNRLDSMGKAIPNAEILVLNDEGQRCAPGEVGQLVHRGPLVAKGYWNAATQTAVRFRPVPGQPDGLPNPEPAVWSGDLVREDEDGFLYFVGRNDDMIKTSGFRVSPSEIEDVVLSSGLILETVALGLPDDGLGQKIILVVVTEAGSFDTDVLLDHCRRQLPLYMVPHRIEVHKSLPRNPNGKIDRVAIKNGLMQATKDVVS